MRNKSLLLGIGVGLLFGLGMVAGTVIGLKSEQNAATFEIDGMVLKAAGSDSSDNFSLATGAISDQAEGAFFLDALTGDLQCIIPYARTGQIGGHFKTNVFNDLQVQRTKKPRLLMVTGDVQFVGNNRPGNSLVYIVDATTGNFAAYYVLESSDGIYRTPAKWNLGGIKGWPGSKYYAWTITGRKSTWSFMLMENLSI